MQRAVPLLVSLVALSACDGGSKGEVAEPVASPAPEASEPEPVGAQAAESPPDKIPTADPSTPEPDDAPAPADDSAPPSWRADVSRTVTLADGSTLRVAAAHEGDARSVVWAQRLDAEGKPTATAKKLRTTSGTVEHLATAASGDRLWVAWYADLPGEAKSINAVASFDRGLTPRGEPRILRAFEDPGVGDGSPMLRPRDDGGVAIAALVGQRPCTAEGVPEKISCSGLQVDLLDADGNPVQSTTSWLEGGDAGVDDLLAIRGGALAAFHAYRGGPETEIVFVGEAKGAKGPGLISCGYPSIDLAIADEGWLVALCPDPDHGPEDFEAPCITKMPDATCGMMSMAPDPGAKTRGRLLTDAKIHGLTFGCLDDTAVVLLTRAATKSKAPQWLTIPAATVSLGTPPSCP